MHRWSDDTERPVRTGFIISGRYLYDNGTGHPRGKSFNKSCCQFVALVFLLARIHGLWSAAPFEQKCFFMSMYGNYDISLMSSCEEGSIFEESRRETLSIWGANLQMRYSVTLSGMTK